MVRDCYFRPCLSSSSPSYGGGGGGGSGGQFPRRAFPPCCCCCCCSTFPCPCPCPCPYRPVLDFTQSLKSYMSSPSRSHTPAA
ncbi:hypothetical protein BO86DRAFT_211158 [Aspergillus japonicus CBS 114.51]|uniref:Uncharacterized protein n=1 Tax=Aspergillus japonicus CBS 114.51 TaxID=1448312 RepID=A0A8T8X9X6_ASPJA|nr:hypothetical protein BO86DRAFT_211158 [Aspergillus japonicus CBS 114.51]RAH85013.1 hypothetical protein BO86DRAFT_211158 [Aspergillus japonicus CBS 114.51]